MQIHSFIASAPYSTNSEFTKLSPFTSQNLHQVSSCDLMGVVKAVQAANKAFGEWKSSSQGERRALVLRLATALQQRKAEFAAAEALDQGLPLKFVLKNSIELSLLNIAEILKEEPEPGLQYSPVGVVALVTPWNLSLRVILDRLIPALLAGNAVIVKVSSQSPVTAFLLSELITAAEVPAGLVQALVSDDPEVKKTLISHPGVRAVSFAGSVESTTGVLPQLIKASVQIFKKIQISSGSKNSAVALAAPEDKNFNEIMNSFMVGQGQLVWNSSRLFFLEKSETEWEERIQSYLSELKPAESIEDSSPWGPCVKPSSFAKFAEIRQTATADQAKLLVAPYNLSEAQKLRYLPPVFTKDMSRCSTLQQDQIHAPFYILSAVKYPFDVPKYSNVSYFGFAAHIWGEKEKSAKVADSLDVGLITYNKASVEIPGAVSAVKQSGFGLQDFRVFGAFFSNVKKMS